MDIGLMAQHCMVLDESHNWYCLRCGKREDIIRILNLLCLY